MAATNEGITLKGNPVRIKGASLSVGQPLPLVTLTKNDLSDTSLEEFLGKKLIVLSVPSLDTPVCQAEARSFNERAASLTDAAVLVVSRDLPFAQSRWCGAEGIENVVALSDYKHRVFGEAFGTEMPDAGILCRAVFVADEQGKLLYVDYVPEVAEEPDYDAVLEVLKS